MTLSILDIDISVIVLIYELCHCMNFLWLYTVPSIYVVQPLALYLSRFVSDSDRMQTQVCNLIFLFSVTECVATAICSFNSVV